MSDEPKKMVGGAVVETAEVEAPETQDKATDADMKIVTTAPGTLSARGIVPVGTKATIHPSSFSENWMRPENGAAAQKLKKWQKAQEKAAD